MSNRHCHETPFIYTLYAIQQRLLVPNALISQGRRGGKPPFDYIRKYPARGESMAAPPVNKPGLGRVLEEFNAMMEGTFYCPCNKCRMGLVVASLFAFGEGGTFPIAFSLIRHWQKKSKTKLYSFFLCFSCEFFLNAEFILRKLKYIYISFERKKEKNHFIKA